MKIDWLRQVVHEVKAAGVPLFVKQDSGRRDSQQGRIPADWWHFKEMPVAAPVEVPNG